MNKGNVPQKSVREICEERAVNGEAVFALAVALFDLSDSQEATAKAIQRLGNGSASTDFGAIEALGMQIETAANILSNALVGAASQMATAIETHEA